MNVRFAAVALALALAAATFAGRAGDAAAEGNVLTVDGAVEGGQAVTMTMAQLEALPQSTVTTRSPWFDGSRSFTGPLLSEVLKHARAHGETITAHALNDYAADLPVKDAELGVILATRLDGKPMPIREKGPIFIIYPYDADLKLQHDIYYTRSVWQVDKLTVK